MLLYLACALPELPHQFKIRIWPIHNPARPPVVSWNVFLSLIRQTLSSWWDCLTAMVYQNRLCPPAASASTHLNRVSMQWVTQLYVYALSFWSYKCQNCPTTCIDIQLKQSFPRRQNTYPFPCLAQDILKGKLHVWLSAKNVYTVVVERLHTIVKNM